jgi:hypothetical protein
MVSWFVLMRMAALMFSVHNVNTEKALREAAHAEVAIATGTILENERDSKKRKTVLDNDEKLKQRYFRWLVSHSCPHNIYRTFKTCNAWCSRDRNREHAKYTRLRKKAYVGKLKDLYDDLKTSADIEESERSAYGEKVIQQQLSRKDVLRRFLSLRETNCRDRALWAAILDENFVLTLPITPFRSFPRSDIQGGSRMVRGIDAVMADTSSMALLAESIGLGSVPWKHAVKRYVPCLLWLAHRME